LEALSEPAIKSRSSIKLAWGTGNLGELFGRIIGYMFRELGKRGHHSSMNSASHNLWGDDICVMDGLGLNPKDLL